METYLTIAGFRLTKKLGEGGYSKVYLGYPESDPSGRVAIKIIKSQKGKEKQVLEEEVAAIKALSHERIIRLIDYGSDTELKKHPSGKAKKSAFIILELAEGGELFDFVAVAGAFSEKVTRYFFHQMIEGMEYLHRQGVSHRDIKPENIMLDRDFNLKIADFGFTTDQVVSETRKGTAGYMAPELEMGTSYSANQADVFAMGVVLFIMFSGHPPFVTSTSDDQYYKQVLNNRLDKFWKAHGSCKEEGLAFYNNEFMELISLMIQSDQAARPTIQEIKATAWYNGEVPSVEEILEEFKQRKNAIEATSSDPSPEANHNIFDESQAAHRGADDEVDFDKLEVTQYEESHIRTKFFSTSGVTDLYALALEFAQKIGAQTKLSKSTHKVTITKEPKEGEREVSMKIQISQVEEGKHCVEFTKKQGDFFGFQNLYQTAKEFFGGHANSTL